MIFFVNIVQKLLHTYLFLNKKTFPQQPAGTPLTKAKKT